MPDLGTYLDKRNFDDTSEPPTNQTLAICRAGFSGALGIAAVGGLVDLYTIQVVSRNPMGPTKPDGQRFGFVLAASTVSMDVAIVI